MFQETTLISDEISVINNVSQRFARQMRWNPRWEFDDLYQELCLFWLKKKRSGWNKPKEWKGAMGRCLACHLKDVQRRECAQVLKTNGPLSSLDRLIGEGFDIQGTDRTPVNFDFQGTLSDPENLICNFLLEGKSKKAIAQRLGKSRSFVHERLKHVRHLAEQFL